MRILALECSAEHCSVALYLDGRISQKIEAAPSSQHSRLMLPMQQGLMQDADCPLSALDFIACGNGPGSFTGTRIATALCQGLAYGSGRQALGVSTLAALGFAVLQDQGCQQVLVAVDARMQEIYWGLYQQQPQGLLSLQPESLSAPEPLADLQLQDCIAVGNAWTRYALELQASAARCRAVQAQRTVEAADIARYAAELVSRKLESPLAPGLLQPRYLRNQVVDQSRPAANS